MKEVQINRNEQRGLIMLRNEVASYSSKNYLTSKVRENMEKSSNVAVTMAVPYLPEPINHPGACSKCAYNTICCSFLSRDESIVLPDKHPLKQISQQIFLELTPDHIDYFIKWNGLLALEEEQLSNGKKIYYVF